MAKHRLNRDSRMVLYQDLLLNLTNYCKAEFNNQPEPTMSEPDSDIAAETDKAKYDLYDDEELSSLLADL